MDCSTILNELNNYFIWWVRKWVVWMVNLRSGLDRANGMAQNLDRSDHPTKVTGSSMMISIPVLP